MSITITANISQIEGNERVEGSAYYLDVRGDVKEWPILGWIEKNGKVQPLVRQDHYLVPADDLYDDGTLYLNIRSSSGGTLDAAEAFPWMRDNERGRLFAIIGWAREHLLRGTDSEQVKRWLIESHGAEDGSELFRRAQA